MKWFLGILVLLLVALVLESGLLAYAAYVLLGLLVLSRFLARHWIENLTSVRECNCLTAEVGENVAVHVTVHNTGWLPMPWVLLEDMLPARTESGGRARLQVKGKRMQLRMIRGGGQYLLSYKLHLKMRGYYQIGPLVLETGDLFGLHRRYRVGTEPHYLLVYPKVVPLQGYDITSRRPIGEVKLTHRLFEDPTRIAGVREYQAGDPLNRVHWRASARTGQLHCKIYEPTTVAGATILLDFHKASYHPQGEPFRSELAVTTAVSLAHALYLMGQQVGLITNGRDAADRIRLEGWAGDHRTRTSARKSAAMIDENDRLRPLVAPTRRGIEQFQHIRATLARVELTDGLAFLDLVQETEHRLPRDATILAVLADVPPETALALGNLRRQGYAVTVVLIALEAGRREQAHGRLLAEGLTDVRPVNDEPSLGLLCQQQIQSGGPYQLSSQE